MAINHFAVIIAAAGALGANFVWFNFLFRAPYIAGLGKSAAEMRAGPSAAVAMSLQLIGFLAAGYVIAHFVNLSSTQSFAAGATVGALLAIVVAGVIIPMFAFQAFSYAFSGIVVGGYALGLILMGAIIGAWR